MAEKPALMLIGAECKPEHEAKFNKWYEEVHIPMMFKFNKMTKVTRCRLTQGEGYPKYLVIYEFTSEAELEAFRKSPERAAGIAEMQEAWKQDKFEIKWRPVYEVGKTWQR